MNIEGGLRIRIRLGDSPLHDVKVESSWPVQVSSLLEGQEVSRALNQLPMMFNICGMAQAIAGIRACEAARLTELAQLAQWQPPADAGAPEGRIGGRRRCWVGAGSSGAAGSWRDAGW